MFSATPEHLTQGDARYAVGDRVEFVVSVCDDSGWRIHPSAGTIVQVYAEPTLPLDVAFLNTYQGRYAALPTPVNLEPLQSQVALMGNTQHRVTGFDVQLSSVVPWTCYDMPEYYYPKIDQSIRHLIEARVDAPVTCIHVPVRHVIRNVLDITPAARSAMDGVLNRFYRRCPCGWLVLFHEPQLNAQYQGENAVPEALQQLFAFDYENEIPATRGKRTAKKPHASSGTKTRLATVSTRRIIGEVVDFGVDYDGVLKLVCRGDHSATTLDYYMFHGPFAEVGFNNPTEVLYKLPYDWVHDAYDQVALGSQTYVTVLKHIICDTLERFRIKTIKYNTPPPPLSQQTTTAAQSFYYGFTEDGMHFAKNGRMVMESSVSPISSPDPLDPTCEIRTHLCNFRWLNLRGAVSTDAFPSIKRGYIIYGRVVVRKETGQTTLEWCTPPPGIDLLRVYLATEGKSTIFRKLGQTEIFEKFKDHNGNATLASKLFERIMDPTARNDAIDYVLRELVWGPSSDGTPQNSAAASVGTAE